MIFMRYIFGICKFTVKYIVAMLRYAKKLRLRHNLLCYCFHRSVSDCPVEARRSREKKGFFLAAISKFRSWQKLEFLEKILEFLEKSLEFFEILEFFWPWVFFKMSKKKPEPTLSLAIEETNWREKKLQARESKDRFSAFKRKDWRELNYSLE